MISSSALRTAVGTLLSAWLVGAVVAGPAVAARMPRSGVFDNEFSPAQVTVEVGEQVRFSWLGQNRHSVNGPWPDPHPGCSSATTVACANQGDQPFVHVAQEVGTFAFNCPVHPEMTGTLTVTEATPQPTATPTPTAAPPPEPEPTQRFTVGPPPPRETAPPVVVEGTAEPVGEPSEQVTLDPFPDPIDPDRAVRSEVASEREDAAALVVQQRRVTTPRVIAFALILGTLVAFLQFVVFGPAWVTEEQARFPSSTNW